MLDKVFDILYKRPLAIASLFFTISTGLSFFISKLFSALFSALVFILISLVTYRAKQILRSKKILLYLIILISLSGTLLSSIRINNEHKMLEAVLNPDNQIGVSVVAVEEKENAVKVSGKISSAGNKKISGVSTTFYLYSNKVFPGDFIYGKFSFYEPRYNYTEDISIGGKIKELYRIESRNNFILYYSNQLSESISSILRNTLSDNSSMLASAMLTGSRQGFSSKLDNSLRRSGVSHIISVSGLHITIYLSLLSFLIKKVRYSVFSALSVLFFLIVILVFYKFSPSVMRACTMGGFVFFAEFFDRKSDSITSLMLAATIILIFSPRSVTSLSFLLSFTSCYAIVGIFPFASKYIDSHKSLSGKNFLSKTLKYLIKAVSMSIIISLITSPILIFYKLPISLVGPLTNIIVVVLASPFMVLSILTVMFSLLPPFLSFPSAIVAFLADILGSVIISISVFFGNLKLSAVTTDIPYLKAWSVIVIFLSITAFFIRKNEYRFFYILLISIFLLSFTIAPYIIFRVGKPRIYFYGDSFTLIGEESSVTIVDKLTEQHLIFLENFYLINGIDKPKTIISLNKNDTETPKYLIDIFPKTDFVNKENIKNQSVYDSYEIPEEFNLEFSDKGVLADIFDFRFAFSSDTEKISDLDVIFLFRKSKSVDTSCADLAYIPEEIILPEHANNIIKYKFGDVIETVISKDDYYIFE
ncbi:MAG: ComEC/Rec2 family competence protein [Ruminococcaceae bacterium]|nr:ComEC/Rec2 family competence protein [Oscillospiraceae bacterium]